MAEDKATRWHRRRFASDNVEAMTNAGSQLNRHLLHDDQGLAEAALEAASRLESIAADLRRGATSLRSLA
jgi:hypothetical protein